MKELCIFLHLGNVLLWDEINNYIKRIKKIKFCLYVNFCKDIISEDDIILYKSIIKEDLLDTKFFNFDNKGSDIGPFFKFLDYLRNNKINHDWIIKIHSKSNNEWRKRMLEDIFPENFDNFYEELKNKNKIMAGSYKYPYDYINIKYDIKNLKILNINILTDWEKYEEEYPETKVMNVIEKNYYLKKNKNKNKYVPLIDLELYNYLFGNHEKDHNIINGLNKWKIINEIKSKNEILFYYPGTFLLLKYEVINELFKNISYDDIYNSLENNKLNDKLIQSNTHSWERILPIIFILYKLKIN